MAAPACILALILGSQTIGLAQFLAQPQGGLILNGYRLREIHSDPANDSARNERYITVGRLRLAKGKTP